MRKNSSNKTFYSIYEWNEHRKLIILDSVKNESIKERVSTEIEELLLLSNILTSYSLNFHLTFIKNKKVYHVPFTGEILSFPGINTLIMFIDWDLPCERLIKILIDQIFENKYARLMD